MKIWINRYFFPWNKLFVFSNNGFIYFLSLATQRTCEVWSNSWSFVRSKILIVASIIYNMLAVFVFFFGSNTLVFYVRIYCVFISFCVFIYLLIFFQVSLVRRILPVTLIQTWLSASECTHTRYRIKTVCWMFTFIIRRDWEGSDVSRFSLANTILKTH